MTDTPTTPSTRGGAVLVRDVYGNVLVSRRKANVPAFAGMLQFPGGSVDDGEDFITGALRELREETGIKVKPVSVTRLGQWNGEKLGVPYVVDVFLYDAELPINPVRMEPEKCGQWFWASYAGLLESPCLPGLREAAALAQNFETFPFGCARIRQIEAANKEIEEALRLVPSNVRDVLHTARHHLFAALNVGR